tara:strand:+ start:565 stop:894 length:330 start_codon:yes stop_codon:yes gene_type:complete
MQEAVKSRAAKVLKGFLNIMATNREVKLKMSRFFIRVLSIQHKFRHYFENNKIRLKIIQELIEKTKCKMLEECTTKLKDRKLPKHDKQVTLLLEKHLRNMKDDRVNNVI